MSENEHVLLILLHHIVGDGWSLQPLTRDFTAAYKARSQGDRVQLETLPVQYADYALWQQQLLGDETTQESLISTQLDFWKEELKGLPDQMELPTDFQRPIETSYRGETIHFHIDEGMHSRLVELARKMELVCLWYCKQDLVHYLQD